MLGHTGTQGRSVVQAGKGKSSALDCTQKRAGVAQNLSLTTSVFQAYISMQVQAKQREDFYEVSAERRGRTVVLLAVALREAHLDQQLVDLVAPLLLPGAQAHRHVAAVDDTLVHAPVPHQREAEVRHRPVRRETIVEKLPEARTLLSGGAVASCQRATAEGTHQLSGQTSICRVPGDHMPKPSTDISPSIVGLAKSRLLSFSRSCVVHGACIVCA